MSFLILLYIACDLDLLGVVPFTSPLSVSLRSLTLTLCSSLSPFLSIFSVFALVFVALSLFPPCVQCIQSVSSQYSFPLAFCVWSICFLFYFGSLCPVCTVFCFAFDVLLVCNQFQLCSHLWSNLSLSCVCVYVLSLPLLIVASCGSLCSVFAL